MSLAVPPYAVTMSQHHPMGYLESFLDVMLIILVWGMFSETLVSMRVMCLCAWKWISSVHARSTILPWSPQVISLVYRNTQVFTMPGTILNSNGWAAWIWPFSSCSSRVRRLALSRKLSIRHMILLESPFHSSQ